MAVLPVGLGACRKSIPLSCFQAPQMGGSAVVQSLACMGSHVSSELLLHLG